jgi:CBS domain-containing protein
LLAGCSAAYLVSLLLMKHTIMTEKLARRGTPVEQEYSVDHLRQIAVRDIATADVVTVRSVETVESLRERILARAPGFTHQGYPVVDSAGRLKGLVTVRDVSEQAIPGSALIKDILTRPPVVVFESSTAREAADQMVRAKVGRLPVVSGADGTVVGIITRSDLIEAHERRLHAENRPGRNLQFNVRQPWKSARDW